MLGSLVLFEFWFWFVLKPGVQNKQDKSQHEENINLYVASLASNRVGGVGSVLRIFHVKISNGAGTSLVMMEIDTGFRTE